MWDDMSAEARSPSGSLAIFSFLLRSLAPFAGMHVQRLYAKLHLNVDSISPAMTANGAVTDDALKFAQFFFVALIPRSFQSRLFKTKE